MGNVAQEAIGILQVVGVPLRNSLAVCVGSPSANEPVIITSPGQVVGVALVGILVGVLVGTLVGVDEGPGVDV